MNIAYYSHYFTPEIGAPSARIYDFARQWLSLGHQVQVVTCFPNHPDGKLYPGYKAGLYMTETLDEIQVHRHWTYVTPNKGRLRKTLGHFSYLPAASWISTRRIQRPDISIGTSPTFFAAMAAASMAEKHRVPFIMEVRDLWPAIFVELGVLRNPTLIRWLEKWELSLYRRADKIVTLTEAFRRKLIERDVPSEKVHTILNGADIEFWQPGEQATELADQLKPGNGFIVLYLGAHGISQGLERILESARILGQNPPVQFIFVGDGAVKENLIRQARETGLKNINFLNPVDRYHARAFYAAADVCLVPLKNIPLFDTFIPSKIFEIMAMARPMIASLRGEAADIVRASGGGLVVDPENSGEIAKAIRFLYEHRERAQEMGSHGRRFVVQRFSRRTQAIHYAQLLESTIEEYRRRRK